ncbi:unnamed protein product [Callosobruchus maculatus]|uniref:C2H2-type domain-containing protein n=1 Tax=Callosobruchus maculatus TaxID=64391 RepID=A0A653CX37_CALMS|nr:unnamed protein product [Callosobruchus maculatus]
MEWNDTANTAVLKLIKLYREREVLWNGKLKDYKNKNKPHDVLLQLHLDIEKSIITKNQDQDIYESVGSNLEKGITSKNQDQDIYESVDSKSFSCYSCNYTAFSKDHLIDHMIIHDNKIYVSDHTKRSRCNANASMSSETDEACTCGQCDVTFKEKRSLDDHVVRKHPEFVTSVTSKLHQCTKCTFKTVKKILLDNHVVRKHPDFVTSVTSKLHECTNCTFKTVIKSHFERHLLKHPELASDFKLGTCIHCNATFKEKRNLDNHVIRKHPDFVTSVTSKLHECTKCTYKTVIKTNFDRHLLEHPEVVSDFKLHNCIHCNATFKSKLSLDNHVLRKHPEFGTSVTSKLHECTKCTFKTVVKTDFDKHLLKHPEVASDFKLSTCMHCSATFKGKRYLDNHVFRKHPEFGTSLTSKLHECTKCTFKTVIKLHFDRHLLKHPEIVSDFKPSTCIHCNATFKTRLLLDDHVVRKHPEFGTSVTRKLHECTKCTFKTVIKIDFDRHLLKHPEIASDFKLRTCIHCNATFKEKRYLDNHVFRKHPEFGTSVTSKLHECTKCTFKTVIKLHFDRHLLKHPEIVSDFKPSTCIHCNATFKTKLLLDDHVVRQHPAFGTSVTSKLHECTKCTFKTVIKIDFDRHLLKHPEVASNFKLGTCMHCNATFQSKLALNDHVVRKHPEFVTSVTSKLHECTKCTFKTVRKSHFDRHLLKHPEIASDFKLRTCIHCNATYQSKMALNDHVVRKHPEFVTSITSKLYECTKCTFKTVIKNDFDRHLLKHPEVA